MLGTTAKYMGSVSDNTRSKRIAKLFGDPFGLQTTNDTLKKPRMSTQPTDDLCNMVGLHPAVTSNRSAVSY